MFLGEGDGGAGGGLADFVLEFKFVVEGIIVLAEPERLLGREIRNIIVLLVLLVVPVVLERLPLDEGHRSIGLRLISHLTILL